jgi:thiamine-monophosphate kinase
MGDAAAIHAAIDISDGLSSEVHHLCRMSRVGARIEGGSVPIHAETDAIARLCSRGQWPGSRPHGSDRRGGLMGATGWVEEEGLSFALSGGEDFELLFTVATRDAEAVARAVQAATGTPVSVIGEAVPPEEGVRIRRDGVWHPLASAGYEHFRDQRPAK